MIFGVCGGIAEYFNLDPTLVRFGYIAGSVLTAGSGILMYIIAAIIIPESGEKKYESSRGFRCAFHAKNNPIL